MTLTPSHPQDWERILVLGGAGSGKTSSWLNIAKWYQQTRTEGKFHVIDTDRTVPRMLSGQYSGVNVEVYPAVDWDEMDSALIDITKSATPNDWIIVDMIGPAWDAVQAYYTEQVFGADIGNFFLEARKAIASNKDAKEFEGWTDWKVINGLYKSWAKRLLFRSRSHVLCCTPGEAVNRKLDTEATLEMFGRFGVKPTGQKSLPFQFSTVLWTERLKDGSYVLTTMKDRERQELLKAPMTDFTDTYLMGVGKWQVT